MSSKEYLQFDYSQNLDNDFLQKQNDIGTLLSMNSESEITQYQEPRQISIQDMYKFPQDEEMMIVQINENMLPLTNNNDFSNNYSLNQLNTDSYFSKGPYEDSKYFSEVVDSDQTETPRPKSSNKSTIVQDYTTKQTCKQKVNETNVIQHKQTSQKSISKKSKKIKKSKIKNKQNDKKYDYIRRILNDIFLSKKSSVCFLNTGINWKTLLKDRLILMNITMQSFQNKSKCQIRKTDFKKYLTKFTKNEKGALMSLLQFFQEYQTEIILNIGHDHTVVDEYLRNYKQLINDHITKLS